MNLSPDSAYNHQPGLIRNVFREVKDPLYFSQDFVTDQQKNDKLANNYSLQMILKTCYYFNTINHLQFTVSTEDKV